MRAVGVVLAVAAGLASSAVLAAQVTNGSGPREVVLTVPLLVLVTAFVTALLGLSGWILLVDRRKVGWKEFDLFRDELTLRLAEFREAQIASRREILDELYAMRYTSRHVDECPYLRDKRQEDGP